jgi:hypothetical protein
METRVMLSKRKQANHQGDLIRKHYKDHNHLLLVSIFISDHIHGLVYTCFNLFRIVVDKYTGIVFKCLKQEKQETDTHTLFS